TARRRVSSGAGGEDGGNRTVSRMAESPQVEFPHGPGGSRRGRNGRWHRGTPGGGRERRCCRGSAETKKPGATPGPSGSLSPLPTLVGMSTDDISSAAPRSAQCERLGAFPLSKRPCIHCCAAE